MNNILIGNSVLSLDHIFIWAVDHLELHNVFKKNGFFIYAGSAHKGQGTIGSYIRFHNFYLEILSIYDKVEFENNCDRNNLKNLEAKPFWIDKKVSPVGIGLHLNNPLEHFDSFATFDYRQEWMKQDTYIKMASSNNEFLSEPSVFIVPQYMKCNHIKVEEEQECHKHSNGSKNLTSVKIFFREQRRSATIFELNNFTNLQVESAEEDLIELVLDENKNSEIYDFRELIPLIIRH